MPEHGTEKKNDKGFQGLSLLMEARAAMKNHFQLSSLGKRGLPLQGSYKLRLRDSNKQDGEQKQRKDSIEKNK